MMATINAGIPIPHGMTAGELIRELSGFPSEATVDLYISQGDRPWESGTKSIKLQWITEPEIQSFQANVILCPACENPLVVHNGQPQGPITFFMRDGARCMTAHNEDCDYKGRETPTFEDWRAVKTLRNFGVTDE
jgi:hypothetical protein